eukprot:TRINITY_DN10237_c0_g1_i1.p1 TRINITY_DN10237_c0_g1~~TRINITY_DN10237_c0_g1_i1.p1  ORF type:complete len:276 (-),score=88.48 TRINITY_DN10237_c0_g1_i1:277-1104(-)
MQLFVVLVTACISLLNAARVGDEDPQVPQDYVDMDLFSRMPEPAASEPESLLARAPSLTQLGGEATAEAEAKPTDCRMGGRPPASVPCPPQNPTDAMGELNAKIMQMKMKVQSLSTKIGLIEETNRKKDGKDGKDAAAGEDKGAAGGKLDQGAYDALKDGPNGLKVDETEPANKKYYNKEREEVDQEGKPIKKEAGDVAAGNAQKEAGAGETRSSLIGEKQHVKEKAKAHEKKRTASEVQEEEAGPGRAKNAVKRIQVTKHVHEHYDHKKDDAEE